LNDYSKHYRMSYYLDYFNDGNEHVRDEGVLRAASQGEDGAVVDKDKCC
jgi:hypothetical protein